MSFDALFRKATGFAPYPYQRRLAEVEWPEVVNIPTGLGKTAAVTLAWLYRRGVRPEGGRAEPQSDMPRRLVWCLPMRTLVEQTAANAREWLDRLGVLGEGGEAGKIAVHTLMGGEPELRRGSWAAHPEQEAVLIGTQDMLLSRALMRGYGMSRFQWPVHYALLHNDSLWVFDEVQLMGPALPTTTQLETFRRGQGAAAPTRSTWVSATLREDWLDTVDFRPHREAGLARLDLDEADRAEPGVANRVQAAKALAPAATRLADGTKNGRQAYTAELAREVADAHVPGEQTLVIVNRVERAQALYAALADTGAERLLLHARFRPTERATIEARLHEPAGEGGRIVVATQAVEAGVDLDSRVLFTELAPWASLVQRFGRCNRAGRFEQAHVYWVDVDETVRDLTLPYGADSLAHAREQLWSAASAAPADLPPVTEAPAAAQVLRRPDLLDLFNTDPDLSGFDVDIAPYIRDTGTPPLQVFWRDVADDGAAASQPGPERAELCQASLVQLREHLGTKLPTKQQRVLGRTERRAWRLDPLAGDGRGGAWVTARADQIRPGQTIMLAAADGGYDPEQGFVPGLMEPVAPVATEEASGRSEGYGSDTLTGIGRAVTLPAHLADAAVAMAELAGTLGLPDEQRAVLETAARWHDVGKAHEAFQRGTGADPDSDPDGPWAKSAGGGRPDYHCLIGEGERQGRPGFRHELASALAWLEEGGSGWDADARDLIAYLVAAHHGRVRLGLRALPGEAEPPDPATLYARGVWEGDTLPGLDFDGEHLAPVTLRLDLMRLGTGPQGPSWSERTQRLLASHGPFRLAWLEALVRIADWRASAREAEAAGREQDRIDIEYLRQGMGDDGQA